MSVDASKTALQLGLDLFEDRKAKHPQTRWTPPTCHDETPPDWSDAEPKPCRCKAPDHSPSGMSPTDSGSHGFGLRRDARGAFQWVRPGKIRPEGAIPKRTLENIAACAAVKVSYWSEAIGTGKLWGLDVTRTAHLVQIDRKRRTAELMCTHTWDFDPVTQRERPESRLDCNHGPAIADWSIEDAQLALREPVPPETTLHLLLTPEQRLQRYCENQPQPAHAQPRPANPPIKPSTPKAGFGGELTAREKRERKASFEAEKQRWEDQMAAMDGPHVETQEDDEMPVATNGMTMKAAIGLLHHDPDYLGDIPTDRLQKLLGLLAEKKYHPRIRRELKTRGVEPKG